MRNGYFYHNKTKRLAKMWKNMMERCYNKNNCDYKWYGARRIKVCDNWHNIENFIIDNYESYYWHVKEFGEKNTTLDRIDNDGDYELKNIKWSDYKEQSKNRRIGSRKHLRKVNYDYVFYLNDVVKLNYTEIANKLGVNYKYIYYVIYRRKK